MLCETCCPRVGLMVSGVDLLRVYVNIYQYGVH